MKKAALIAVLFMTGCTSQKLPLVSYERQETKVQTYRTFSNVIYYPTLRADNVLDLEFIDEAQGYYLINEPTQRIINELIEKGFAVYVNEDGEIIVCIK